MTNNFFLETIKWKETQRLPRRL